MYRKIRKQKKNKIVKNKKTNKITNSTIQLWLTRILDSEGGYVNHPNDPGGETKWGISKRSYPHLDIASLTIEDASQIYKQDYLKPLHIEKLKDGVVFQLFDFAVNSGIRTAIKQIQKSLNITSDGVIGPITLKTINKKTESDIIMLLIAQRIKFYTSLKTFDTFGKGWMNRISKNLEYGAKDS